MVIGAPPDPSLRSGLKTSEIPESAQLWFNRLGWRPTGPEQEAIIVCRKAAMCITGGEGGGKSEVVVKHLLGRVMEDDILYPDKGKGDGEPLQYWLVGDSYSQVKQEFQYLVRDLLDLFGPDRVDASGRIDPGHIEVRERGARFPWFRLDTKSGKDPTTISGVRPQGTILCEAGQMDHRIFELCHGRAMQGGGWIIVCGTLEGSLGWYPQIAQSWSSGYGNYARFKLPTWTNSYLFPGGRNDPRILELERTQSDEYFLERIAGEVVPPKGLVFGEFRADLHIREVSYNPEYPVHLWEDPGYGIRSAHALEVVQYIDGQLRVIDEIYDRGILTDDVITLAQRREWWKAPRGIFLVSDPHYKDQHHSVHSVSDVWLSNTGLVAGGERVKILPGIERLKTYLKPDPLTGNVGLVIAPHCQGLLSEFGAALDPFDNTSFHPYRWKTDRFGEFIGPEPADEFNHALKALIYGICFNFGYAKPLNREKVKVYRRGKDNGTRRRAAQAEGQGNK